MSTATGRPSNPSGPHSASGVTIKHHDHAEAEDAQRTSATPTKGLRDAASRDTSTSQSISEAYHIELAAKHYVSAQRHRQLNLKADRIHNAATRVPNIPFGSSGSESDSDGSDKQNPFHRTTVPSGDEVRLRVDDAAPLSLSFNGDMEGRTLELVPAENGMTDIVIGNARGGESARDLRYVLQARRDATEEYGEKLPERDPPNIPRRREGQGGSVAYNESFFTNIQKQFQPISEDYEPSDVDKAVEHESRRMWRSGDRTSWSAKDDETLVQVRAQGLKWNQIAPKHFHTKSPNACRKRHELLMKRQNAERPRLTRRQQPPTHSLYGYPFAHKENSSGSATDVSSSDPDSRRRLSLRDAREERRVSLSDVNSSDAKMKGLARNIQAKIDDSTELDIRTPDGTEIAHQEAKSRSPSPVLRCEVEGCIATFTGEYREGTFARHMVRRHQRSSSPTNGNEPTQPAIAPKVSAKQSHKHLSVLDGIEEDSGLESLVGQPGMPASASQPLGPKLSFEPEHDQLLIELKEVRNLTWKHIADFFPGCALGTLKARYYSELNPQKHMPSPRPALPHYPPELQLSQSDLPSLKLGGLSVVKEEQPKSLNGTLKSTARSQVQRSKSPSWSGLGKPKSEKYPYHNEVSAEGVYLEGPSKIFDDEQASYYIDAPVTPVLDVKGEVPSPKDSPTLKKQKMSKVDMLAKIRLANQRKTGSKVEPKKRYRPGAANAPMPIQNTSEFLGGSRPPVLGFLSSRKKARKVVVKNQEGHIVQLLDLIQAATKPLQNIYDDVNENNTRTTSSTSSIDTSARALREELRTALKPIIGQAFTTSDAENRCSSTDTHDGLMGDTSSIHTRWIASAGLQIVRDQQGGVDRCPLCTWEVRDSRCPQCELVFDEKGKGCFQAPERLQCPYGCKSTFVRPGDYRRHMKKHPRSFYPPPPYSTTSYSPLKIHQYSSQPLPANKIPRPQQGPPNISVHQSSQPQGEIGLARLNLLEDNFESFTGFGDTDESKSLLSSISPSDAPSHSNDVENSFRGTISSDMVPSDEHWPPCAVCKRKLSGGEMAYHVQRPPPIPNYIVCHSCRSHTVEQTDLEPDDLEGSIGGTLWQIPQDEDDNISVTSSYAASVASIFSQESLASSASDLSKHSGYSEIQIATATKELLSIFVEDRTLLPLYKSAIENPSIGPERLQRNLRRLFRAYAEHLASEATDTLEYLASRLVLLKSRVLAQYIVAKFQSGPSSLQLTRGKHHEESSDEEEESNGRPVNEAAFEDLVVFREFLVGSEAFRTLCAQVQAFVTPKPTMIEAVHLEFEKTNKQSLTRVAARGWSKVKTWPYWLEEVKQTVDTLCRGTDILFVATNTLLLAMDAFFLTTDNLLVATGQLEPALKQNMVRLRWHCSCGESHYSDVMELRKGGVAKLITHMRRTSGTKACAVQYNQHSGSQRYIIPRPSRWLCNVFMKISSVFGGSSNSPSCLPQHNTSGTATVSTASHNNPSQQKILHLLACMHRNRLRKVLQQDHIEDVTTDRTLLCFLRQQYARHRGRFLHILSLKSVKGIFFVKFRLPIGGSVDVRHHNPCCMANATTSTGCECIPPKAKVEPSPTAEYRCIPGPPATYPPVPPEYLSMLFTCPTNVHEQDTWILDQLPKRTCGELQGKIGQPAEGWGIYYQEGWDRDLITFAVFLVFLLASLLFGVLWSKFQFDVQGAFGVSAYMVTAGGILVTLIATRADKMG